jgi:hypothetical protein
MTENEEITKTFINTKTIDKYIDETIQAWGTARKASINNLVDNYGYYYEGGEDGEYSALDHLYEIVADREAVLKLFAEELSGIQDRILYSIETMKNGG